MLGKYYHTIRHLKWVQIRYRLWYWLSDRIRWATSNIPVSTEVPTVRDWDMVPSIDAFPFFSPPNTFCFLNLEHQFGEKLDWNFSGHGKLWTYNLNYFEFLMQADLPKTTGLRLIRDFIAAEEQLQDGLEPFPISLRIVFWIRFLSKYQIRDSAIEQSLYRQLLRLNQRLEYHLLGNHLLENAFALLIGAAFLSHIRIFHKAAQLLDRELNEQILGDGAHFERSPMYHQLMLYRLLDVINCLSNNALAESSKLLPILREKAAMMLGWLQQITFANGDVPRLNDSVSGIAPDLRALSAYAGRLGLDAKQLSLGASGYRKIDTTRYELLVDVGAIGPDYIPGHAHSDTFSFVLYHRQDPLIVDPGISTYEKNERRQWERSTAAHNTVVVDGLEQSEIWGGFRVARRARVVSVTSTSDSLAAVHDGYRRIGLDHRRTFHWDEQGIEIDDQLTEDRPATAYLHFYPGISLELQEKVVTGDFGSITFTTPCSVVIQDYCYALGFNRLLKAQCVAIQFRQHLNTKIQLL